MNYLNTFKGNSFADKIYNYLISIGVSAKNIHSYIEIMKDGGRLPVENVINIGVNEMNVAGNAILSNKTQQYAPDTYYVLSDNSIVNVGVNIDEIAIVDIYMYISSKTSTMNIDSVITMYVDNVVVKIPSITFVDVGFYDNEIDSTWIPVFLATTQFSAGNHLISLAVAGSICCNLSSVTIISHPGHQS